MAEGSVERITGFWFFFFVQKHFFLILLVLLEFSKLLQARILANAGDKIFDEGVDSCMSQSLFWNEMHLSGT